MLLFRGGFGDKGYSTRVFLAQGGQRGEWENFRGSSLESRVWCKGCSGGRYRDKGSASMSNRFWDKVMGFVGKRGLISNIFWGRAEDCTLEGIYGTVKPAEGEGKAVKLVVIHED